MIKNFAILLGLVLLFVWSVSASEWSGVEPGKSSRLDLTALFGQPSVSKGDCLSYHRSPRFPGTTQVNFCSNEKGIIQTVDIFPDFVIDRALVEIFYGKNFIVQKLSDNNESLVFNSGELVVYFSENRQIVKSIRFRSPPAKGGH